MRRYWDQLFFPRAQRNTKRFFRVLSPCKGSSRVSSRFSRVPPPTPPTPPPATAGPLPRPLLPSSLCGPRCLLIFISSSTIWRVSTPWAISGLLAALLDPPSQLGTDTERRMVRQPARFAMAIFRRRWAGSSSTSNRIGFSASFIRYSRTSPASRDKGGR